jgi:hypothetical protein
MIIKYSPEGEEPREFEFYPSKLLSVEAEAIENVGGNAWETFEEFGYKFIRGNVRAYRAALWIMLKRHENPKLKFQDLAFKMDEVSVDYSKTELTNIKEAIEQDEDSVPENMRETALAQINKELANKESEGVVSDLKEPIENSENIHLTSVQPG